MLSRSLLDGMARLRAIAPDERRLRALLVALVEAIPGADCAALTLFDGLGQALVAAVGLEAAPTAARGVDPLARSGDGRLYGGVAYAIARGALSRVGGEPGPPFPAGTRGGVGAPVPGVDGAGALVVGSRSAPELGPEAEALVAAAADRVALAVTQAALARERSAAADVALRAEADLAERRRAIDFVLGVVGHDLRNPLGAVHMSAALLHKKGGLAGWQARAVERMRSSAGRMTRIIADLLSYTRTRLGAGLPIHRRPARLDEIARRAVDELAAVNPGRTITVDVRGDPLGEWDPDRLEQVVSNLVSNALEHGDPAAPVVVELDEDAGRALLRVRNRGPAVPPEVLAHLFEPFSRPPEEKSRTGSGLGLGLYIAREIVSAGHGGEISVRTGDETVIEVRLPRG
jgi:signal transduction histidine kinase